MAVAYCLKCDYPLAGVPSPCPECGRAFDPANPSTFSPKPNARRRRWARRVRNALLAILLIQILIPRQVTRIAFAWQNPDNQTITIHTRWCFLRPAWLPIRYPGWSTERIAPSPAGQIPVVSQKNWRVGLVSVDSNGGFSIGMPSAPDFVGTVTFSTTNPPGPNATNLTVTPENIDELCRHLVYESKGHQAVIASVRRKESPNSSP